MAACRGVAPNIFFVDGYLLPARVDLHDTRSHATDSSSARWVVKVFVCVCVRACRDRLNRLDESALLCTAKGSVVARARQTGRERTRESSNPNKFGDLSLALRETLIKDARFLLTSLTCKLSLANSGRQALHEMGRKHEKQTQQNKRENRAQTVQ